MSAASIGELIARLERAKGGDPNSPADVIEWLAAGAAYVRWRTKDVTPFDTHDRSSLIKMAEFHEAAIAALRARQASKSEPTATACDGE